MAKPFRGVVNVDVTESIPDWGPYTQAIAPEGTASVLYIVLDDVGFSGGRGRSTRRSSCGSATATGKVEPPIR